MTRVLELLLPDAARVLGSLPDAFRAVVRGQAKRSRNPNDVRFGGLRCWMMDGQWVVRLYRPWIADGHPLRWLSLKAAASHRHMKPASLRRQLERHAVCEANGAIVARWKGLVACKFGRNWRVCLGEVGETQRSLVPPSDLLECS